MPETAKVRNSTGAARYVPVLQRVVEPGEVITLLRHLADGLTCQPGWEPATKTAAPSTSKEV
jgi:hypothetical protein